MVIRELLKRGKTTSGKKTEVYGSISWKYIPGKKKYLLHFEGNSVPVEKVRFTKKALNNISSLSTDKQGNTEVTPTDKFVVEIRGRRAIIASGKAF